MTCETSVCGCVECRVELLWFHRPTSYPSEETSPDFSVGVGGMCTERKEDLFPVGPRRWERHYNKGTQYNPTPSPTYPLYVFYVLF